MHSLGEGTDAGQTWFLAMTAIVVVPALVLLLVRHLRPSSSASATLPGGRRPMQHTIDHRPQEATVPPSPPNRQAGSRSTSPPRP